MAHPEIKKWRLLICCLYLLAIITPIYAIYESFSPSGVLYDYRWFYSPIIGICIFVITIKKCDIYDDRIPKWKNRLRPVGIFIASIYFTYLLFTYGLPSIFNRLSGHTFTEQHIVTGKMTFIRLCKYGIGLDGYSTLRGKACCDKDTYSSVNVGDTVTVYGYKSILGSSLDIIK